MGRDVKKEKFWREKMAEYEKSGLTVRELCARDDLREVQFYYWRRELKDRGTKQDAGFVELVRPVGENGGAGVRIRIDGGLSIVLECGFDVATLKSALAAVGEVRRA